MLASSGMHTMLEVSVLDRLASLQGMAVSAVPMSPLFEKGVSFQLPLAGEVSTAPSDVIEALRHLRVGFLSSHDYLDRNAFSGTLYSMHRALTQLGVQVINLGMKPRPLGWAVKNKLFPTPPIDSRAPDYVERVQRYVTKVNRAIQDTPCDVIFAPVASAEISFLTTMTPIVYLSDTTFGLYRRFYKMVFEPNVVAQLEQIEQIALDRATKAVYSSQWAAESALKDYGVPASKLEVVSFGANLERVPSVAEILERCTTDRCRLLFVGKEWERKGGDAAFATLVMLLEQGMDVELLIVGCKPPDAVANHDRVQFIPYLDKNNPRHRTTFDQVFLRSHFLLLPTRADCTPMVIAEANAYGMFVLTTDIGGITSLVRNGRNGYALPETATADAYAKLIQGCFSDRTLYRQLLLCSREEYDSRLNWDSWAQHVGAILAEVAG
jgi:glycosyltransferase involved in cell wall biosynthesis